MATTELDSPGYTAWGLTYLPTLSDDLSHCVQDKIIQGTVPSIQDIPINATLIAFAPLVSESCAAAIVNQAISDNARLLFFVNTGQVDTDTLLFLRKSNITTQLINRVTGSNVFQEMSKFSSNVTLDASGTEIPNSVERVGVQVQTEPSNPMPKFWIFILAILGGLLAFIILASVSLNALQNYRRKKLRQRILNGEVNLELLGVKRLTVPQEFLDKMPVRVYTHGEQHFHNDQSTPPVTPSRKGRSLRQKLSTLTSRGDGQQVEMEFIKRPETGFSQINCPICLEDFENEVTQVRQLACDHIYHLECIDTFLTTRSSLCPLCKQSTLPVGYFPESLRLTNATVRREREMRQRVQNVNTMTPHDVANVVRQMSATDEESRPGTTESASASTPQPLELRDMSSRPNTAGSNTPEEEATPDVEPLNDTILTEASDMPNLDPGILANVPGGLEAMAVTEEEEEAEERRRPIWRRALQHLFPT